MQTNCVHIFICTNIKSRGKCCGMRQSKAAAKHLGMLISLQGERLNSKKRYKVVETGCLGQCAYGPNLYIAPNNVWYSFSSLIDIEEIFHSHLVQGKIVSRLINKGIYYEPSFST